MSPQSLPDPDSRFSYFTPNPIWNPIIWQKPAPSGLGPGWPGLIAIPKWNPHQGWEFRTVPVGTYQISVKSVYYASNTVPGPILVRTDKYRKFQPILGEMAVRMIPPGTFSCTELLGFHRSFMTETQRKWVSTTRIYLVKHLLQFLRSLWQHDIHSLTFLSIGGKREGNRIVRICFGVIFYHPKRRRFRKRWSKLTPKGGQNPGNSIAPPRFKYGYGCFERQFTFTFSVIIRYSVIG